MSGIQQNELLRRAAVKTQRGIVADTGMSLTAVNGVIADKGGVKLSKLAPFLASLGVKMVDMEDVVVSRSKLHSLASLAQDGLTEWKNSLEVDDV